jgi:putative thioredoxin
MSADSPWLIDTTDKTFEVDVIERSKLGMVVVDFWAEWCAPCRMLGPVLEKLARELDGRFTLVKAETDHNPNAAEQFAVAGIPAVFAVMNGQVIDQFEGALPEPAIRQWLDGLEGRIALEKAVSLLDADRDHGLEQLRELCKTMEQDEQLIRAAQAFSSCNANEDVQVILDRLEERGFLEPEAEQLKSALALASHSGSDSSALRVQHTDNPSDRGIALSLAKALVGEGKYQEAFEVCLDLVENDRNQTGEEARLLMIDVFKALPPDSSLVSEYRRRLSMLLF